MTYIHSNSNKNVIGEEFREYVEALFGDVLAKNYFEKISTPMEEYTLHVFQKYELIEGIKDSFRQIGYEAKVHNKFSNVIITKPKGPFPLEFEENMKEMIVDNRAAEMIYQGSDIFIPGVKRANKVKTGDIIKVMNQEKTPVAKAQALLDHHDMLVKGKGVAARNLLSPFKVPNLQNVGLDDFPAYFQSLPAYLTSINLEPEPNEKILDCCAAPGNKTIHLNELSKNKATIIAVDKSKNRMQKLNKKIAKYRLKNIQTKVGDIVKLSKSWSMKFDKILIDPPCSSLGLRPRLVHNVDVKLIKSIAKYQKAILFACDKLLKNNGTIIYSTCTITKEENEEIIHHAIENMNYRIVEQNFVFSEANISIANFVFPVQRFIPGIDHTLGYFIAKLQKSKS
ncbi:MAG: methyltransferase domain-containing protein [Candidatus Heimdallarchaeaceae archaeon]